MALPLSNNPPEFYLGSATKTQPAGAGTEIFGPCPWAVACVGSRKEKTVARWLLEHDVPYFLPYLKERSGSGNQVLNPVFEGIVFFQSHTEPIPDTYYTSITPREYEVRRAPHVFELLRTAVQVKFKRELAAIYQDRTVKLGQYQPGDPVKVIDGPWAQFTGLIIRPDAERPLCQFRMEGLRSWAHVHIPATQLTRTAMKFVSTRSGEVVEAERFYPHHLPWHENVRDVGGGHYRIKTATGEEWIESGDYIVTGPDDVITHMKAEAFNQGFEPITAG